jgi:hypothetical protein
MTSNDNLTLILRRLDEIERKLDRMLEELRTPAATDAAPGSGDDAGLICEIHRSFSCLLWAFRSLGFNALGLTIPPMLLALADKVIE